jgi:hypothetical protein
MKYMLWIYQTEGAQSGMSESGRGEYFAKWGAFDSEACAKTTVPHGAPLDDVASATTVRLSGRKAVMSDGPFGETKEQLGGFYMIDAKHLDEAAAMAAMMPHLEHGGAVEVGLVLEM